MWPFKQTKTNEPEPITTIRTITTDSGSCFRVIAETNNYVMCRPPQGKGFYTQAIADIESMASQGYWICSSGGFFGSIVTFEKRGPALVDQLPT